MAREPSYPDDKPVGGSAAPADKADTRRAEVEGEPRTRTRTLVKGAAIGIGSAALVAALLYANRSRKTDKS